MDAVELLVTKELDALGYELVELRRGGSRSRPVLEVRMERRDGATVTVNDCAAVSRVLEAQLEATQAVATQYVLEVSSPGADRPLRSAADWRRFLGRRATVTSGSVPGGKVEVEILSLDGEAGAEVAVVRDPKSGTEWRLPLGEITRARLAFHWKR